MNFTIKVPIPKSNNPIDYSSKVVSFGSCFAENIAEKLDYFKFENTCNPFGILFHPLAIEKIISKAINLNLFSEKDVFFYDERWHCFDVHSDLSNYDVAVLVKNLNTILQSTHKKIAEASHFIITYGTSWVYNNIDNDTLVANCHKVPQNKFRKELLSLKTIERSIQNTIELIQKVNPDCKIIFTVSPVRHLKDGLIENQVSKAHLNAALFRILNYESCNLNSANYFPSYEIMMDELRDYRFYAQDLLHPSQMAIDYIWERFSETIISDESQLIMQEVESIQKGLSHRPFNSNSEKHKKFLSNLNQKMNTLASKFSQIQF
jgi:hypothetical protein